VAVQAGAAFFMSSPRYFTKRGKAD